MKTDDGVLFDFLISGGSLDGEVGGGNLEVVQSVGVWYCVTRNTRVKALRHRSLLFCLCVPSFFGSVRLRFFHSC